MSYRISRTIDPRWTLSSGILVVSSVYALFAAARVHMSLRSGVSLLAMALADATGTK